MGHAISNLALGVGQSFLCRREGVGHVGHVILFDQSLTNYLFTCIQSSSILESQFKINRHFAFSRVDVRESGNNGDIWQCYLIKSVFLNPVLLNSFWWQWSTWSKTLIPSVWRYYFSNAYFFFFFPYLLPHSTRLIVCPCQWFFPSRCCSNLSNDDLIS